MAEGKWIGFSKNQVDAVNSRAKFLADQHNEVMAYCGWLMCNSHLRCEHDKLVRAHAKVFGGGMLEFTEIETELESMATDEQAEFMERWRSFYTRWRLVKLTGPGLPVRAGVRFDRLKADFTPAHLQEAIGGPRLSDVHRVPDATTLRNVMGGSGPCTSDDHLNEWQTLIASTNVGKKKLNKYPRLFQLQHYWKVLFDRHGPSLKRQNGRLEKAFAEYLCVDKTTIHSDLNLIRRQLGRDWLNN